MAIDHPVAQRLARAASLLAAATVASRLLGVVREIVNASFFGAANDKAAYVIGYYVPYFIQRLLLGGTLSIVFIPTITEYLTRGDREETARVSAILFNLVLLLGVGIVLVGEVVAPLLVRIAAPGFQAQAGLIPLAVRLTRIIFVAMLFLALAIFATGFLQAHQRFTAPALAPLLFNLVIIAGTLWLGPADRLGIQGLAVAWVGGTAAQFFVQIPAMRRAGFTYRPVLWLGHPAVRKFVRLALPAMLGLAVLEINTNVSRFFASFLPATAHVNAVAVLDYAYEVMQAPVGIIAISMATAIFPTLARQAAREDPGLRATTAFGLRIVLVLILPVVGLVLALAHPLVRVLFQRGEFTPEATVAVAAVLRAYTLGLGAIAVYYMMTRAFYALEEMVTPVKVGAGMVLLNGVLAYLLMRPLGAPGIALATSTVNLCSTTLLLWLLRRRIGGFEGGRIAATTVRAGAAAALAGIAAAGVGAVAGSGGDTLSTFLQLAAAGGAGAAVYLLVCLALRVEEIQAIRDLLLRRAPVD